jgi:hypothetical protein
MTGKRKEGHPGEERERGGVGRSEEKWGDEGGCLERRRGVGFGEGKKERGNTFSSTSPPFSLRVK